MKHFFLVISVLMMSIAFGYGQKVTYDGKITDMDTEKSMSDVTIRVLSNGAEVTKVTTSSNGNYLVQFPPGKPYVIEYSKPGYVKKIIKIDVTQVNEEDMPPGGKIFPPIDIDLFTEREGADFSFLNTEPVVEWYFDRDRMNFDSGKVNRTRKKITDKLKEAEDAAGKSEAQYNALIQEADKLYTEKKYKEALDKYVDALKVPGKQAEKHPNNRLLEIEALLQKKAEEELAFQQENQAYLNVIAAADNLAANKEYDKAIAKYNEAIAMKSDEQYPKDKIAELNEEKENASKREEYDKIIKQADGFFKQNSLQASRDKYQEASRLLPKEEYPKSQLELIAKKLEEQSAEREKREKYNKAIEDADALYNKEDYEAAIAKYKEAISYESASSYPVQRIEMAETELAKQKAANENLEAFNKLVAEGDGELTAKNYKVAIEKYKEALVLFDEDAVKVKLASAQESLEKQKGAEEEANKIATLLASAKEKIDAENYKEAIEDYQTVLTINAQNTEAIEGKAKAEQLLINKESNAAKQQEFDKLVKEGDDLAKAEDYLSAISKYNEALVLIENDAVNTKRDNAQKALEEKQNREEEAGKIASLLASAQDKMSKQNYSGAIEDYQNVLTINSQNPEAIQGKAKAESLLAEEQSNVAKQKAFDELVKKADQDFNNGLLKEARAKYIEAKAIFADKKHVNDRIEEIRVTLEKQSDKERIAEEIQVLLEQAATHKSNNKWNDAILKYEAAIKLDDQRKDVHELLAAAKLSKDEWDAKQSKEEQFAQLKEDGNVLMAQKNWSEAQEKFEEALKIKEDAEIKSNLEIIKNEIAAASLSEENEKAYQDKMKAAEALADAENFEQALSTFEEALGLKQNDPVATSRIKDMQQKIDQLSKQGEKEQRYNEAMSAGEKALEAKDYAAAIKFFDDALIEKPLDNEATKLKNKAKDLIKNLQSEEEQYMTLLQSGQEKYDEALSKNNDIPILKEAKLIFEDAQKMRPNASLPQNKIVEIDELLRQIEEAKEQEGQLAEINRRYKEQLELASVAAQNSKYENAINYLKEASSIKPNEEFPKKKIKEYQDLLDQIANANTIEKRYTDLINKADLAFDGKNYEESIDLYSEALTVKQNEQYPKDRIELAKKAISDLEKNSVASDYQNFIDKADEYFAKREYNDALAAYKLALDVKSNDSYAKDKIDETQQIIDNQKKEAEARRLISERLSKQVAIADALFNKEEYVDAIKEYEKALEIDENDTYTIERIRLSIQRSKEKTEKGDDARYQKILAKADEYFDVENYDKAIGLYERALSLRNNDQYPKDKLAEITDIRNGNVKTESQVEYLGEQSNISIMEGAALLEEGAKQREQMKQQAIEKQILKNEGLAEERSTTDYQERVNFENEITSIKDRRSNAFVAEEAKLRVFIDHVDNVEFETELRNIQTNNFERGEVMRTNQNLVYITDEMDATKLKYNDDHTLMIERIKDVKEARDDQSIAEAAHHKVRVTSTKEELLKVDEKYEDFIAKNEEFRKDREVKIDDIEKGIEVRLFEENHAEYNQVMQLQNDALIAEIRVSESKEDKLVIHQQLQDDIYALDAMLQRKYNQETTEAYQDQLLIDNQLTAASDQFTETQEGKDDARLLALEQLKDIDKKSTEQSIIRSGKQYEESQNAINEVQTVHDMQSEQSERQQDDLAAINEEVIFQESAIERANNLRDQDERTQRHSTVNEIERIKKQEELLREGKEEQIKENYEDLKVLNSTIDNQSQFRNEQLRNKNFKTQEIVNQLENNKLTFNEAIANTLGDEYPEGVSQENYIRRDKDGIPVKIVTRRFVIKDGRGDVYIRIQNRNGLTYSKNGMSVTEQSWINGTENALLEKHY